MQTIKRSGGPHPSCQNGTHKIDRRSSLYILIKHKGHHKERQSLDPIQYTSHMSKLPMRYHQNYNPKLVFNHFLFYCFLNYYMYSMVHTYSTRSFWFVSAFPSHALKLPKLLSNSNFFIEKKKGFDIFFQFSYKLALSYSMHCLNYQLSTFM